MKDPDEQKKKHSSGVLLSVTDAANNHTDYCREGAAIWSNSWQRVWSAQIDSYSSCLCEGVLILIIAIISCNSIRIKYESQENAQKWRASVMIALV